jgi:hypothetical protein
MYFSVGASGQQSIFGFAMLALRSNAEWFPRCVTPVAIMAYFATSDNVPAHMALPGVTHDT